MTVSVAGAPLRREERRVEGGHVEIAGELHYRIVNYDAIPPFLMSLVSDSDHWTFVSSNGALTAGRRDPDHALFPYCTDDVIHASAGVTGPRTILFVARESATSLWEPFSDRYEGLYRISRRLYKSVYGNKIIFEEVNEDLALAFSYAWLTSERFGFVRRAGLVNQGGEASVEILDGIENLLPHGITRRFQMEYSTLADGYKESELDAETGLALYRLSSIPTDKAEPSEALRATVVWATGLEPAARLLSSAQVGRFRQGQPLGTETRIRGRRGAYFLNARVTLTPGERREWRIVADVDRDASDIAELRRAIRGPAAALEEDIDRGTRNLVRIVASADGLQLTGDALNTWRHFSNALFNVMRGGVPDAGYTISRADLAAFIAAANREVSARQRAFLAGLPETIAHRELLALAAEREDADLDRLIYEYLPLTFSRRHGDPSRPWNIFAIAVRDEHGNKILNYQGNWRDIFQNWEALALSFPGYIESMIFKFVDASTADGHNPYRVMRDGFDWEVLDPHDPWSYIGYWGDHQVVYLLRLIEASAHYHPGALRRLLARCVFTYADVPYRIKPYEALLADPHNTIEFDAERDREVRRRAAALGGDGRSVPGVRVNLAEKLLLVALARLVNFVPGGGIWMNTQRPEWNDGNNALVGCGVSMVTLCYLRRFLSFCLGLFEDAEVSAEIAELLRSVAAALERHAPLAGRPVSDGHRKRVLDELGGAGSAYRERLYARGLSGERTFVPSAELRAFCGLALRHVDHSIRANRRDDGLYHSYNVLKVTADGIALRHLQEMLEGQVAVLSSDALSVTESVELLDALRASKLWRADRASYVLYPDRLLPAFREKNNIPAEAVERSKLLAEMLAHGDRRIVTRDADGGVHFNAAFRNAAMLKQALAGLGDEAGRAEILELYETVFDHQSFTGRSGTFYKYEGLGCIYWHMVAKLAVAVAEVLERAPENARLVAHYREIREGIGVHKPPEVYGAIPTDPYSHTPGFAGVQQPGMTGQVKEDLIARFRELGAVVREGRLAFDAHLLDPKEFLTQPATFRYYDVEGNTQSLALEPGTLAFTVCQVPVVAHRAGPPRIEIDGRPVEGLELDAATSAAIFNRTGAVRRLDVFYGTLS